LHHSSERRKALTFFCIIYQRILPTTVEEEIKKLAENVLSGTDFFLVGVEIKGANRPEVWVYADGVERGINMDECAELSNELSFLMDAHETFAGAFLLNVSSPGLSRPLTDRRQYPKNEGRQVKVKFKNEEGYHKIKGMLERSSEQQIVVQPEGEEAVELSFDQVVETKIIPSLK
jgi:ribosome maturation factor RimP